MCFLETSDLPMSPFQAHLVPYGAIPWTSTLTEVPGALAKVQKRRTSSKPTQPQGKRDLISAGSQSPGNSKSYLIVAAGPTCFAGACSWSLRAGTEKSMWEISERIFSSFLLFRLNGTFYLQTKVCSHGAANPSLSKEYPHLLRHNL